MFTNVRIISKHDAEVFKKVLKEIKVQEKNMNSLGHLLISISKSGIRIASCIVSLMHGTIWPLAVGFLAAEVLGIAEELVDKR